MKSVVPTGAVLQPLTEAEYEREGARTKAPNALMNVWRKVGAFTVPDRSEGRYNLGGSYQVVDPRTAVYLKRRARSHWQHALNGYPFVQYGRFTVFCMGPRGDILFSFDPFVVSTDEWDFLQNLADDLGFVERLVDEHRRRDNPAATTNTDIRAAARGLIAETRPAALRDLRTLMPQMLCRFPGADDATLVRAITKDELACFLDGSPPLSKLPLDSIEGHSDA